LITRKLVLWLLTAVTALLFLAGCDAGGAATAGSSWPGFVATDDAIYLSFGSQVFAIDPETGDDLWRFPTTVARGQTFYATPAVDDDIVVVGDYTGHLYALDTENGNQRWLFDPADSASKFVGGAVIGDKYVYVGNVAGVMYAIDKEKGTEGWRFSADRDIWSAPLLADGTLYFTTLDRHLYALDAETGEKEWQYPANDVKPEDSPVGPMVGTPTLHDGILYFGDFSNKAHALSLETHELLWSYESSNWVWSSPVWDEDSGYLIGGDVDGNIFALDPANDGKEVWKFEATGPVVSPPVIGEYDGNPAVFVTSGDANLYVLDPKTGEKISAKEIKAEFEEKFIVFPTGTSTRPVPLYAPPVVVGNLILLGTHDGPNPLIALDAATLNQEWVFDPAPAAQ
jgi:eukaryotic-like serine/threonine-protein kinase